MEFKESDKIKRIMKGVVSISSDHPSPFYHSPRSNSLIFFTCSDIHTVVMFFTYSNGGNSLAEQLSENGKVHATLYPLNTTIYHKTKKVYLSYC